MPERGAIRVLVVEDAPQLEPVCDALRSRGHMAVPAATAVHGVEELAHSDFDVVLMGVSLPDHGGAEILQRVMDDSLPMEAIALAPSDRAAAGVDAMRLGAYAYLITPARPEEIDLIVTRAAEKARLRRENSALRRRLERQDVANGLVAEDPAMRELLAAVERVAPSDLPVLVQGEPGTGKETLARAIHRLSGRSRAPFVALDCRATPEDRLEGELFGFERGALSGQPDGRPGLFEVADGGVLFLEEVGAAGAHLQARLLRALETQEFFRVAGTRPARCDVRLISSTRSGLRSEMQEGRFREDLYYRLNGVTLKVPPLRERKGDIVPLARHFLQRTRTQKALGTGALETLLDYAWPGNVRELRMVVERAALLGRGEVIEAEDLILDVRDLNGKDAASRTTMSLAEMEREYIATVLRQNAGHRGRTARALGIDPKTLYNKLGPERPRKRPSTAVHGSSRDA